MAIPTSMTGGFFRAFPKPAGLILEAYPSTVRGLTVEIQSATANSTLSSKWNSVIIGPSSLGVLRHKLDVPESTRLVYCRARHPAQAGYSNGPFTPVISARSRSLPWIERPFLPQMTYQGNIEIPSGSDVFVTSAKTVKVGSQVTSGNVSKTLRYSPLGLVPNSTASHFSRNVNYIQCTNATTVNQQAMAPISLPVGVMLTQFRVRFFRAGTSDGAEVRINNADETVVNTIKTLTSTGTSWHTKTSSALTHVVASSRQYHFVANMFGKSAGANSRLAWMELTYKMPDYAKGI